MDLHEVLAIRGEEVIARWKELVRRTLAPQSTPSIELVDHMPEFLLGIIAALKEASGTPAGAPEEEPNGTAAVHGAHRLRMGFSVGAVIQEYGLLRTAIVDTALDAGVALKQAELQVLFDALIHGIAEAVSEYSRRRDAEFTRQASEHFAFVAHELGNPIGSARVALELLKRQGGLPEGEHAVGALERGLAQASELILSTLQNARVASGRDVHRTTTTLHALVADSMATATADAVAKGVVLRKAIENDRDLGLDHRLIRSALDNLVRNGVKYTPSGGNVEVRARVAHGRAIFEVEDCCGGLPPGELEQAFAPFVRLDERQGGFGLGLAIAKQAVDAHGGTLRVQSLPGKGCLFVMELPATDERAA